MLTDAQRRTRAFQAADIYRQVMYRSPDQDKMVVLADEAQRLRTALELTESNLRRLIAAQHHDRILMEPWLAEVQKSLVVPVDS